MYTHTFAHHYEMLTSVVIHQWWRSNCLCLYPIVVPGAELLLSCYGALCGPTSLHEGDGMLRGFRLSAVENGGTRSPRFKKAFQPSQLGAAGFRHHPTVFEFIEHPNHNDWGSTGDVQACLSRTDELFNMILLSRTDGWHQNHPSLLRDFYQQMGQQEMGSFQRVSRDTTTMIMTETHVVFVFCNE